MPRPIKALVKKAIDMSQAARMRRAQDMGFDTKRRLVHTSSEDIPQFDFSRLGQNTEGNATDEALAQTSKLGAWFSDKSLADEIGGSVSIPAVAPKAKKTFKSLDSLSRFIQKNGGPIEARNRLKADGIDVVNVRDEEFGGISTVVLDASKIRSPTAAFDPAKKGSPNLLAGVGGATATAGLLGASVAPQDAAAALGQFRMRRRGKSPNEHLASILAGRSKDSITPLPDNRMSQFADFLLEDRPSEMNAAQRGMQSLGMFQGLGEWARKAGRREKTTFLENLAAALDVVP